MMNNNKIKNKVMCENQCVPVSENCCGAETCNCDKFSLSGCSGELFLSDEKNNYQEIKLVLPTCDTCDSHVALILSSIDRKRNHEILNKFKNKAIKITIEELC
jgi:hypothetical protein